jgi:hypothetical protein
VTAKKDPGPSVSAKVEADGAVTVGVTVGGVFVPVAGATADKVSQATAEAVEAAQASDDNTNGG